MKDLLRRQNFARKMYHSMSVEDIQKVIRIAAKLGEVNTETFNIACQVLESKMYSIAFDEFCSSVDCN